MSKQKGLILSETFQTEFLPQNQKQSQSLLSYFWRSNPTKQNANDKDLRLFQIHNRFCLIVSNNQMSLFSIEPGKDLFVEHTTRIQFQEKIVRVETNWMLPFQNILVIIGFQSQIVLFTLDQVKNQLVRKSSMKIKQINSLTFVNGCTFWVVSKHTLLTEIDCNNFILKKTRQLSFNINNISSIYHGLLVTPDFTGKEYHFYYFFFTRSNENKLYLETIYVKQLIKKQDGSVMQGALFKIKQLECINPVFNNVSIQHNKDIFWLTMEDEIVLIKKKQNSYYFMDTIRKKTPQTIMRLLRGGILCVISKGSAQLSSLAVTEPKCIVEVFDMLIFHVEEEYTFFQVLKLSDQYLFMWKSKQNQFKMKLAITKVQDAMKKIVQHHLNGVPMSMIDHLAKILKIPKKDFYTRLWYQSNKDLLDIRTKLMLCEDIGFIKDEIKLCLRKKNNSISQVIEIYSWFYELIRFKMAKQLNIGYLKMAAQCHFLLRKLKIQTDQSTILGLKEIGQIKNKSIIQSLEQTIINQMKLSVMCSRERDKIKRQNSQIQNGSGIVKTQNVVRNVFYEFRYALLQNYDLNLFQLLRPFGKDLAYIFQKFPFLLPTDPCQFQFSLKQLTLQDSISSDVNKSVSTKPIINNIFSSLNEFQWQTEMSVAQIKRYLLQYHPTSTVEALITHFVSDEAFKKLRLTRHATIYTSIEQYLLNVKLSISGIKLHLRIIQFSNIINWNQGEENLQQIIQQLADIFKRKNNLTGQNLQNVRLYGRLHALLIRNNFQPLPSIQALIQTRSDQLISSFFLGNRQKINLILNQLKDLFDNVTGSEAKFNRMIEQFVKSDNCSPVQLKLLFFYVDKKGKIFQDDNQLLIESLIDGFCKRTQVGEIQKIQQFTEGLSNISLSLDINERIMKIIRIKQLYELFKQFNCEKQPLYKVEFEGFRVLSLMLENYFVHQMYNTSLNIQEQVISLQSPRNMLNVLLYLQQQLYSHIIDLKQVVLMFGQRLVEYEAFDDLKQFLQQKHALQRMDIDPVQYSQEVIRSSFYKLYNQPSNFNHMKDHIQEIIKLKIQDTAYLQYQFLKIKLCQLINDCNFEIHPNQIGCGANRVDFMWNFIEQGYENLDISKIQQIYYCFKRMSGDRSDNIDENLLLYITLFTKTCIKNQRLQSGIEGIIYLLRNDCFDMIWQSASQAFLQNISKKYPDQSKQIFQYIQFFSILIEERRVDDLINLFINQQLISQDNYQPKEDQFLEVHESLVYLKLKAISITLKDLRDLARKVGIVPKNIYRYYYFGMSILSQPQKVSITHIQYNIAYLDDLVDLLCKKLSLKANFVGINLNQFNFRKCFLNALCEYGCHLTNQQSFKIDSLTNFDDQLSLINMIEKLKQTNQNVLLKVIRKNIRFLQQNKVINSSKEKKVARYQQSILDQINAITIDPNMLPSQFSKQSQSKSVLEQKKGNKNMTLKEFLSVTMNLSMNHPTLNQKHIIQMIKQDSFRQMEEPEKKQPSPIRQRRLTVRHTNFQQFEFYLQQEYFELFDNKKYYQIECKQRSQMIKYLKEYYNSDRDIGSFIKLLQGLKLSQQKNIKIVQSALRVNTHDIDFKKLFKFDFYFYTPDIPQSQSKTANNQFFAHIFQYLTPSIKEIIKYDNWQMLSKIIYVSSKLQKEYQYKVIMFALEIFLGDYQTVSDHFLQNIDQFISKLAGSSIFLAKHYRQPLQACESVEVWRIYLEKILECLKKDQNNGRLQQSQRQFVETTISQIQSSLNANDFDQQ